MRRAEDDVIAHQVIDGWAYAKATVSAACNLSPYAASKQMRIAKALRDRLPQTAGLFATGAISAAVIDTITWRTKLITDPDVLALVDTAIAGEAVHYGSHSEKNLIDAVDLWVEKFDPVAVIRSKREAKDLYVEFDDKDDPNGVSSFWGRLRVTDKKALQQRLEDLADTVCPGDPRTRRELRAAALGSLGVVGPSLQRLTCQCGDADCPGSGKDPRSGAVVIYALTDQVPDACQDTPRQGGPGTAATPAPTPSEPEPAGHNPEPTQPPAASGDETAPAAEAEPTKPVAPAPAAHTKPAAPAAANPSPGAMLGGIIPAAMLADLIATGATVKPLPCAAALPAERQYRPSATVTAFVRLRSMTCSFPGCNRPAHRCDTDHLVPWPAGATHPGNLHPLCREHHLLKTICGWAPRLKPDGTMAWTSPAGHTYAKRPGAAILFPHWNIETSIPRTRAISLIDDTDRDTKMPTRARTRAQDREHRINAERARNALQLGLELAQNDSDPPPF